MTPKDTSFAAQSEVFLEGQRFEVTDIEVGPDGCLYLATAGGGETGGVYRVSCQQPASAPPPWAKESVRRSDSPNSKARGHDRRLPA